jgi:hypothetical protein
MKLEEINNKTNEAFSFLVAALESGESEVLTEYLNAMALDMTLYYAYSSKKQKRAALDNYAQHIVPDQTLRVPLRVPASAQTTVDKVRNSGAIMSLLPF